MNSAEARKYSAAIGKGAGMIEETRLLLEQWRSDEPLDDFTRRVQETGLLGKSTAYRSRDLVRRVFAPRFLRPDDRPARILLSVLAEKHLPRRVFTELLFIFAARRDPLVYDFTVQEYWPAVHRGRLTLDTAPMLALLAAAREDGRLDRSWSEQTALRVARSVLGLLRDVGFLRKTARGRREIVHYRMSDEGAAILAWELHEAGVTDASLGGHPDWGLFGLTPAEVLARLDGIGEHRGLLVQRAGSVVHYTWSVNSIEDLIHALAQ